MAIDPRSFDLLDVPPWLTPCGTDLVELPREIINLIAYYLGNADLLNLRALSNRGIRNGIDHVWSRRSFTYRRCRTTDLSISRLEAIASSRFAKNIRSIVIEMYLECEEPELQRYGSKGPPSAKPCVSTDICLMSLCSRFTAIFKLTTNLDAIRIRAPPALRGLTDENFRLNSATDLVFDMTNAPGRETHYHIMKLRTPRMLFQGIITAIRESRQQLDTLAIYGFTTTTWQSLITLTTPMLDDLAKASSVQSLTRLELELEMFTDTSREAMLGVVKLIEGNAKLQCLKLWTGPDLAFRYREPTQHWSSLLDLLGSNPSFRLRSLDLDGLTTGGTTTLDHIIQVHSQTLRHIVLNHTNFHHPNSIRAFFAAMAETDLEYFAVKNFWMHDRCWMGGSILSYRFWLDEGLQWSDAESFWQDDSYLGWVEINWDAASHEDWFSYDNINGKHGRLWMKERMMNVVEMVDCGGIQDY